MFGEYFLASGEFRQARSIVESLKVAFLNFKSMVGLYSTRCE